MNCTALNPGCDGQAPQMVQMVIGLADQHEMGHNLERARPWNAESARWA